MTTEPLLDVSALRVRFPVRRGFLTAVDGVDMSIRPGERVAIVGESGAGKSVTAMALMGLVPAPGEVGGSVRLAGRELIGLSQREFAGVRGGEMGLILQDAVAALDPLKSIGSQIEEPLRLQSGFSRAHARERALELVGQVGIGDPAVRIRQRGYELSGGMAQRALIAAAVGPEPRLLIADEPTSALDATTAEGVLDLLGEIVLRREMAVLLITHDLGVVARFAERVIVMYAGRVVEEAGVQELFAHPRHPYTRGLLESVPGARGRRMRAIAGGGPDMTAPTPGCAYQPRCPISRGRERCLTERPALAGAACHFADELDPLPQRGWSAVPRPAGGDQGADLVALESVSKAFRVRGGPFQASGVVQAVQDVSLGVRRGEVLALVGESGCGKSTLARIVLGLEPPTAGRVLFDGQDATEPSARTKATRRRIQVVFQNPDSSLNPRMTVERVVAEPLDVHGLGDRAARRARVSELIERVGLRTDHLRRYPFELSGGQRQRVAIARALAPRPDFLVCDEPLTALDVTVQAQILDLLQEIQREDRLSCLFVAHDLGVVRELADRVAVMYLGNVVEVAEAAEFFARPHHPYSLALLSAASSGDPAAERRRERIVLSGAVPSPLDPPPGCPFHTRCWKARERCAGEAPPLVELRSGRTVACHYPEGLELEDAVAAGSGGRPG